MNKKTHFFATLIMVAATAAVLVYANIRHDYAIIILSTYVITISLFMLIYSIVKLFQRKTTVETGDIAGVTENLNTEIVLWTDDCSAVFMNKCLRNALGITDDSFDSKEILKKIFNVSDMDEKTIQKIINGELGESTFHNAYGGKTCISWSTSLFKESSKSKLYLSAGFNLTEIKKMQTSLRSSNDCFMMSMELSEIGVMISRSQNRYYASPQLVRMLGLKSSSVKFSDFRALVHPNDRIQYDSCLKLLETSGSVSNEVQQLEMRIKSADGTYRWYSYRFKIVKISGNSFPVLGGAFLDITQEREKDMLIERLAYIDDVTEIANRNKLVKTGEETYKCCRMLNYSYWVIVLDIDRFHIVNDTCGYDNGNVLLRDFAHLLYKYISPGGLAARISGDNFALVLRDYGDEELPIRTVSAIQDDILKLANNNFSSIKLSCSAGYSKMPGDGNSFLDVLEHAEFALKSSSEYQGSITAYEPSMHDSIIGNTELEKELSDAIDNNELQLFYQPKINLADGKIMGVEALVRWIKPDGTIMKPDAFVPIAESSHLIGRISQFVLNEACRQNMLWQKMGYPNIVMSINFASSDFYQKDLKDNVFEALVKSGLQPQWLEVELTETLALRDIDFAVSQMNSLRSLGVKLAMDDFGTGYSSLSYIQILPITLLKLDRSFITDIERDNIAYEIVSAVIRIAKSKKIEIIAEGIENGRQAEILRKAGCDFGQGYLYGKPMPAEELQKFFEKNAKERSVY